jgi:hypothetical protein
MTLFKHALTALVVSGLFVCAPHAWADEWNKKTTLTIDQQIQLPSVVLEPGTYVFKLLDSQSDRHIVQIFNKEENHLITTILAIPNYRLQPTGKTIFAFWETPAGQVPAVRAWFYPGDNFGQEFAYPKNSAMQMAAYTKTSVPTSNAQSTEEMNTAPVTSTTQTGQTTGLDTTTYTAQAEPAPVAPAPTPTAQTTAQAVEPAPQPVAPAPVSDPLPQELPHTASEMPVVGLMGALSLFGYALLKRRDRSAQ